MFLRFDEESESEAGGISKLSAQGSFLNSLLQMNLLQKK